MWLSWRSHHYHHTRYDFDKDLITWCDFDIIDLITAIILDMSLIKILSLSSYLMWILCRSYHCYYTWYDFDKDLSTVIILDITISLSSSLYDCDYDPHCYHDFDDDLTVMILIVTLMMISSLGDDITLLMISSQSSYFIWLCWWWSHHCYHTWYDYDDDFITYQV
jgi:hypothetical protein